MEEKVTAYWQKFMSILPPNSPYRTRNYIAESWGDSPELADELGDLIARGIKTATCSALWEWEAEGNPIPHKGRSPSCWMAAAIRSASSKPRKSRSANIMKWMPSLPRPKAKVTFPWTTGGKPTEISFRGPCQKSEGNFQRICLWYVNGFK